MKSLTTIHQWIDEVLTNIVVSFMLPSNQPQSNHNNTKLIFHDFDDCFHPIWFFCVYLFTVIHTQLS